MQALMERVAFQPVSTIQVKPCWQLDPDLVLYLPFWNMPDGQVFLSQDAYGHTCTRYGATPTGQNGWLFDGDDDYVDAGSSPALRPSLGITVCAWVRVLGYGTNLRGIASIWDGSAQNWGLSVQGDGSIRWGINGIADNTFVSSAIYTDSAWRLFVGTYDKVAVRLYVGTVQVDSNPQTADLATTLGNVRVGWLETKVVYFNGYKGEVCVYNRGLTELDIQNYYDRTAGRYEGRAA